MKSVVVTGAERGVGRSVAETLLKAGYRIIAVSISMDALVKMKEEMVSRFGYTGERIALIAHDLRDMDGLDSLVQSIRQCLTAENPLWGYVNNAAIYYPSSRGSTRLMEITPEDMGEILKVNMIAAFILSREMFRILWEGKGGGAMVFISSLASKKGSRMNPVYGMTKAAVANLAKSIASEGGKEKIRANAISPGAIETQMGDDIYSTEEKWEERKKRNVIERACTLDEVACLVKYLLSEEAGYMTGENLDLSGGNLIR